MNKPALRVILIGGTSNVGKSTLAQSISSKLGWHYVSTDTLARHPGRPWGAVRPHVAEHYLSLSPDELIEDVLRHYRSMWPGIQSLIASHACDASAERLVLEGSALWPESVAELRLDGVAAVWLTADDRLFQERIYNSSAFEQATGSSKEMVEKFVARTRLYNQRMMEAVRRLSLPCLNVGETTSLEELTDETLKLFGAGNITQPRV